jgi:N-acetylneuraminic acid mutarotase
MLPTGLGGSIKACAGAAIDRKAIMAIARRHCWGSERDRGAARAAPIRDILGLVGIMRILLTLGTVVIVFARCPFAAEAVAPRLPEPVSDNAVAMLKIHGRFELFSLMGIGPKKTWDTVTNVGYEVDSVSGKARAIHAVPGTAGRLAAMAVGADGRVYLFGGYVIFQGGGTAVNDANMYQPEYDRWIRTADIPTAVGDSVIGVYRDRYIYLIGGRTNARLVSDVQMYDLDKNRWEAATSMPGAPVFGHAGAIVNDTIVYVDGARKHEGPGPTFVASDECWEGKIDRHNAAKIEWTKLPNHPGPPAFRIAAGGSEKDERIYFSGGSDNPHDYNGIGYDGKPSEPSAMTFAFNLRSGKWETLNDHTPNPTMDHRGLLVTPEGLVILGGMEKGQQVAANIVLLPKPVKTYLP